MPPSHLILCHPLHLLPSIFPNIRVFSNESALCICWPKYWGFSFSISPSSEHSGLISFRMDWLDLLAVQGTLKSLLQHHSSKASILRCSTFFIVQLSLNWNLDLPWYFNTISIFWLCWDGEGSGIRNIKFRSKIQELKILSCHLGQIVSFPLSLKWMWK